MMPGMQKMQGMPVGRKDDKSKDKKEEESEGFLVEIEGYSSYKNIEELLDPEHGQDRSKWGFVTRLVNLAKVPGGRFEVFGKGNTNHFKLDTGPLDLADGEAPLGIGFEKEIERVPPSSEPGREGKSKPGRKPNFSRLGIKQFSNKSRIEVEDVLVDPMTNEEMSKTFDLWTQEDIDNGLAPDAVRAGDIKYDPVTSEPKYLIRDHWFRISAKFKWKDGPKAEDKSKVANRRPVTRKKQSSKK